jgi:hypothetical protein
MRILQLECKNIDFIAEKHGSKHAKQKKEKKA